MTAPEAEFDVLVTGRQQLAEEVIGLTLRPTDAGGLPAWTPGAHIDLVVGEGRTRQYSLCGDPGSADEWQIAVLREPEGRGGSLFIHDNVHEGDTIAVRGPRNHFALAPAASYLFIAGGIGITPILPMLRAADAAGAAWDLLYSGRRCGSMAFVDDLAAHGGRVRIHPKQERGPLDLAAALRDPRPGTLVYCCGPERMLDAVEDLCADWPAGSVHVERFVPRTVTEPVRSGAFQIVLRDTGLTLTVPAGSSILSVVEAAGVNVLTSCAEGTCGTCETAVLAGLPDHRDSVLNSAERQANDCMMICVSRSRTPQLVLDL